jgi:branched-chain amino acid transport system substrate-binding protein
MRSVSAERWRIGLLFSNSGATALPETEHAMGVRLAIDEVNASGGVLGRAIEAVAYDPAGELAAYRRHAERLMTEDAVSVIFGCHMSDARKVVLRSVERRNGLLLYPSSYEGFEYSPNVLYAAPVTNQSVFPLADYAIAEHGGRVYLAGCDYVFPRETNRVMRDLIEARGGEVVGETYVPVLAPRASLEKLIVDIRRTEPDFVFSTLVGETGQAFLRMHHDSGPPHGGRPVATMSIAEAEVARVGAKRCAGVIAAASYFASVEGDANARFRSAVARRFGSDRPVSMWSASSYAQARIFFSALETAGSLDTDRLVQAAAGMVFEAPEGPLIVDADNNHAWLTPRIGRANRAGGFDVVWSAPELVRPDPYLATSPVTPAASAAAAQ